jgi:hypothetical protein
VAVAAPELASLAGEAAARLKKASDEMADDPIRWSGKLARKFGIVCTGIGAASYLGMLVGKKLDQSYLNDITNTLGMPAQAPPTSGSPNAPPQIAPPPAQPPQIVMLNQIVSDINDLGTASAAADVALLQDALNQLWNLSKYCYGVQTYEATQSPQPATGTQLAIAIMQTCSLIYMLQGIPIPGSADWQWQWWVDNQFGVYEPHGGSMKVLDAMTTVALTPFRTQGPPDWASALSLLSNVEGTQADYKVTLNGLAADLNASQPFQVTNASSGNQWGVLGVVVTDLSAVGAAIMQGADTVVDDVTAFAKDVGQFAGDVGQALGFLGKVILNLPRLGFDSLGFAAWWAADMVFSAIWLPFLTTGVVLLAYSVASLEIYPRLKPRLELKAGALWSRLVQRLDPLLGTAENVKTLRVEQEIEARAASVLPPAEPSPPLEVPSAVDSPPHTDAGPAVSKNQGEGVEEAVPTVGSAPPPPAAPTPTASTEAILGGVEPLPPETSTITPPLSDPTPAPTPEELDEMEENREASLPPPPRQTKEERDRLRAEALLAEMNEAFA